MNTYISRTGWYELDYPDTWEFEENDTCTDFVKAEDGAGALQISAYQAPEPQSAAENLREYLEDEKIADGIVSSVVNGHDVAKCSESRDGWATQMWFVCKGTYLLFVTYTGEPGSDADQTDVEAIVGSIRIVGPEDSGLDP